MPIKINCRYYKDYLCYKKSKWLWIIRRSCCETLFGDFRKCDIKEEYPKPLPSKGPPPPPDDEGAIGNKGF